MEPVLTAPPVGSHATVTGGLAAGGLGYAAEVGAEVIQVFVSSPRGWAAGAGRPGAGRPAARLWAAGLCARHVPDQPRIGQPGGRGPVRRGRRARASAGRGDRCPGRGGARGLGRGPLTGPDARERALAQLGRLALPLLDKLSEDDPDLLFEPMAGQGQMLFARAGDLDGYLAAVEHHPRAGACLDTCHLFAAGHDLTADGGVAAMLAEQLGPDGAGRVKLVHANDSLLDCGSRRDRHETIGPAASGPSRSASCSRPCPGCRSWSRRPAVRPGTHVTSLP